VRRFPDCSDIQVSLYAILGRVAVLPIRCDSVYISAVYRLRREFPGRRLEAVIQQYSPNMTNMWPYLRQREQEILTRKRAYQASFLSQALDGRYNISERLWTSPDHVKQTTIAVRSAPPTEYISFFACFQHAINQVFTHTFVFLNLHYWGNRQPV
jgi:hypothetical protein